jgi:histidine triad (HIT) family protein
MNAPGCKFCGIAAGEAAAEIVYENGVVVAFLDSRPLFPGHTLLVPKRHVETLGELPDYLLAPLFGAARLLARAVEAGLEAEGSFLAINNRVSQSVPHLHVHIVPRRRKDGLKGFFWPRQGYRDETHMREVRDALRRAAALLDNGGSREGG